MSAKQQRIAIEDWDKEQKQKVEYAKAVMAKALKEGKPLSQEEVAAEVAMAAVLDEPEAEPCPAMPVEPVRHRHRPKIVLNMLYPACVARPVTRKEASTDKAAMAALHKEWSKLRLQRCWDEDNPREWKEVRDEARRRNKTAHVGRVFDICVEKGSELPKGSPGRKVVSCFKATAS
jgi:hypothetical protein